MLSACGTLPESGGASPSASSVSRSSTLKQDIAIANPPSPNQPPVQQAETVIASPTEAIPEPDHAVYFERASTDLSAPSRKILRDIAAELSADRRVSVTLIGRTDDLGSKEFCVAIANRRTKVIEDELMSRGVKANQIRKRTRGCETAWDRPCITEACRRLRRSVELKISGNS